jgi:DNA repair photolyase
LALKYESATPPSKRIEAIEKLQRLWYDVAIRLSPFVPWLAKVEEFNKIKCDKILIEFLRVNHRIKKRFGEFINEKDYSRNFHWYNHLPFEKKKELVKGFTIKEVTVCDFEPEYLDYWKKEFNPNPDDCCNLRH